MYCNVCNFAAQDRKKYNNHTQTKTHIRNVRALILTKQECERKILRINEMLSILPSNVNPDQILNSYLRRDIENSKEEIEELSEEPPKSNIKEPSEESNKLISVLDSKSDFENIQISFITDTEEKKQESLSVIPPPPPPPSKRQPPTTPYDYLHIPRILGNNFKVRSMGFLQYDKETYRIVSSGKDASNRLDYMYPTAMDCSTFVKVIDIQYDDLLPFICNDMYTINMDYQFIRILYQILFKQLYIYHVTQRPIHFHKQLKYSMFVNPEKRRLKQNNHWYVYENNTWRKINLDKSMILADFKCPNGGELFIHELYCVILRPLLYKCIQTWIDYNKHVNKKSQQKYKLCGLVLNKYLLYFEQIYYGQIDYIQINTRYPGDSSESEED